MVFSSGVFLFLFLPVVLALYYICPGKLRNTVLFVFSLIFYAWGEPIYVGIMIFSTAFDYCNGMLIETFRKKHNEKICKIVMIMSVVVNLGILAFFKYTDFVITNINNTVNITSSIGWKNESRMWNYFQNDGSKAYGWINPDGNWYYLNSDGNMLTGWVKDGQSWYYMNESGVMARGWKLINNLWYYLQGDGSMATGLRCIDGKNYYLKDNGDMATGWVDINDYRYFFNSDGSMQTGWFSDDNGNSYYYFDKTSGKMVSNCTIDGYEIDADGKRKAISHSNSEKAESSQKEEGKVIVVDPGHAYGKDEGVKTTIDGVNYSETELNMQVAEKLKSELEKRGFTVLMTRGENEKNCLFNSYIV